MVDVKTLLLLGAGMVVLSLVGFCSVQSRSAALSDDGVQASMRSPAGSEAASAHQIDTSRFLMKGKIPAAPVGTKPVGRSLRPF